MYKVRRLCVALLAAGLLLWPTAVYAEEVETTISQIEQCNTGDGQGTQVDVDESGTWCCTEEPVHNYENI